MRLPSSDGASDTEVETLTEKRPCVTEDLAGKFIVNMKDARTNQNTETENIWSEKSMEIRNTRRRPRKRQRSIRL